MEVGTQRVGLQRISLSRTQGRQANTPCNLNKQAVSTSAHAHTHTHTHPHSHLITSSTASPLYCTCGINAAGDSRMVKKIAKGGYWKVHFGGNVPTKPQMQANHRTDVLRLSQKYCTSTHSKTPSCASAPGLSAKSVSNPCSHSK